MGTPEIKPFLGIIAGLFTLVIVAALAFFVHPLPRGPAYAFTLVIGVAGLAVGWLAGFLLSPYNSSETQRFAKASTAVSAFLTGYLVSKIDPAVTELFSVPRIGAADSVLLMRLLVFMTCVIVGSITMYTYREYIGRAARDLDDAAADARSATARAAPRGRTGDMPTPAP